MKTSLSLSLSLSTALMVSLTISASAQTIELQFNKSSYNGGYNISCNGATDGSITMIVIGGTAPFTYQWSNNETTKDISNLAAGTYNVTVTDDNSVTATGSVTLLQPSALGKTLTPSNYNGYNISIYGLDNGSINLGVSGGTPPYSFLWSNAETTEDISNLVAGNYSVTITDMNNCTTTGSITLTQPTQLVINSITSPTNAGGFNISCYGGSDGSITVSASGGVPEYTYRWEHGPTSNPLNNQVASTYHVVVTDRNGAGVTASITLTQPQQLSLEVTKSIYSNDYNLSCHNCANGYINTTVTGGIPGYTYDWKYYTPGGWINIGNTVNITNLDAGQYLLRIFDALNCHIAVDNITLLSPARDDWSMNGNTDTDPDAQYIGTSDNTDFVMRTNNQEALRITSEGDLKVAGLVGNGSQFIKVNNDGLISAAPQAPGDPWVTDGNNLNGNAPTGSSATEWIGTIAEDDFVIKTNQWDPGIDHERMRVTHIGLVGIETKAPQSKLHLNSTEEYTPVPPGPISPDPAESRYYIPLPELDEDGEEISINYPENVNLGLTTFQITNNTTGTTSDDGFLVTMDGGNAAVKNQSGSIGVAGSTAYIAGNHGSLYFYGGTSLNSTGSVFMKTNGSYIFRTNNASRALFINNDGRIGIGTSQLATGYQLSVYGKIKCEELMVKLKAAWGDFVFEKDYNLMSLKELEEFVNKNNHLPGIPSAREIEEKGGFETGEMQRLQMIKIEELYLYVIELNKKLEKLEKENKKLHAKIKNK
jgi:hypothetical protein